MYVCVFTVSQDNNSKIRTYTYMHKIKLHHLHIVCVTKQQYVLSLFDILHCFIGAAVATPASQAQSNLLFPISISDSLFDELY